MFGDVLLAPDVNSESHPPFLHGRAKSALPETLFFAAFLPCTRNLRTGVSASRARQRERRRLERLATHTRDVGPCGRVRGSRTVLLQTRKLLIAVVLATALAFTVSASAALVPGVFDPGNTGCVKATFIKKTKTLHLSPN
jgi:hypothetical protein